MKTISRRCFLKGAATTAVLSAASPIFTLTFPGCSGGAGYFEQEFGITDAACRRVLAAALAKGGDYADLFFEHTISNYLILEDGKVNEAYSNIALGVGIRTVKGNQVGYGFTQELVEKSMMDAAATAATIAAGTAEVPPQSYKRLKTGDVYPLKTLFTEVPIEPKLSLVQSVNDQCFALSKHVIKVNAVFHDQQKRILIINSDGVKAEDLQPRSYLATSVVAEKDGRRERSSWASGSLPASSSPITPPCSPR